MINNKLIIIHLFILILGKMPSSLPPSSKVVLVYFLGGCTYSEISALRFLGRLKGKCNVILLLCYVRNIYVMHLFCLVRSLSSQPTAVIQMHHKSQLLAKMSLLLSFLTN